MISSFPAALALEAARMAGLDVARIAARAGLAMSDVSDPDVSIPLARLEAVWTAITEEPGGMDVGLTCLDSVRLSVGARLATACETLKRLGTPLGCWEALARHARELRLHRGRARGSHGRRAGKIE